MNNDGKEEKGIAINEPEYTDTGLTVPIKIRAERIMSFSKEAANFDYRGEHHIVHSSAGHGNSGDALILTINKITYVVNVADFIASIVDSNIFESLSTHLLRRKNEKELKEKK